MPATPSVQREPNRGSPPCADAAQSSAEPAAEPDLSPIARANLTRILSGREFGNVHGPTKFDLLKTRRH